MARLQPDLLAVGKLAKMAGLGFVIVGVVAAASMLLVFNWRRRVNLVRTVLINKPVDEVWSLVDYLGPNLFWKQNLERVETGQDKKFVQLFYAMTRDDGSRVEWTLEFDIVERIADQTIKLRRAGIEGMPKDDRLLELDIDLSPKKNGTEVSVRESWGPRSLTGFALAHMDAASMLARLKSFAETGNAAPKGKKQWSSIIISAASLAATGAAFSLLLGWETGIIFVGLLVLHELGHLVSFRMIGQPWGKIIFMPFLGGVAVSRVPHLRLADDAFCALMGAGLSLLALMPAVIVTAWDIQSPHLVQTSYVIAAIAGALNVLNLLPVFPLDGGRVLRALMQSVLPAHVRTSMFAVAGIVAIIGWWMHNPVIIAIAIVAFFQSTRLGPPKDKIALMTPYGATVMCGAYLSLVVMHGAAMVQFWPALG
jgi:Zn-dependent protease/uncharacterized membrane protein